MFLSKNKKNDITFLLKIFNFFNLKKSLYIAWACIRYVSFQILGKITSEGVFLEQLETDPGKYLPEIDSKELGGEVVKVICFHHQEKMAK